MAMASKMRFLSSITTDSNPDGHNQWTGAEAVKDPMPASAVARIFDAGGTLQLDSGFTIDSHTGGDVKQGYAVDIFPGRSTEIDASHATPEAIKNEISTWKEKNKNLLADPRGRFKIGGWVDPKTGHFWLGATRVYDPKHEKVATKMGQKANQKAIANLHAIAKGDWPNAFIDTKGTGTPVKLPWDSSITQAAPAKHILVFFKPDATTDYIHTAIMKHLAKGKK